MRRAFILMGAVVLATLFLVLLLVVFSQGDVEPYEAGDLVPHRSTVEPEDNGYFLLDRATRALDAGGLDSRLVRMRLGEDWDSDIVRESLERSASALDLALEAARRKAFNIPEFDWLNSREFKPIRDLSRLLALRGQLRIYDGDAEAGVEDLFALIRIGRLMAEGNQGSLDCMIAEVIQSIALSAIDSSLGYLPLDRSRAHDMIMRLDSERIPSSAVANMYRWEYRRLVYAIDLSTDAGSLALSEVPDWMARFDFFYKPNLTKERASRQMELMVELASREVFPADEIPSADERSYMGLLMSGNAVGEILNDIYGPSFKMLMNNYFSHEAAIRGRQVQIAVAAFERAHGRVPDTLLELVPEFLPEVPLDPFSGSALGYSASHRLVYSVGSEGEANPAALAANPRNRAWRIPEEGNSDREFN